MIEEIFVVDILQSVTQAMRVRVPDVTPITYFNIVYQPGRNTQIIEALKLLDCGEINNLKYPLIAVVMPISEKNGSGFTEVTFPRIVIANLTKTNTGSEFVIDKYSSDGVFKTILRPCLREFINRFAWSIYTNMGDPDAYDYTVKESPCQQPIGEGLTDFVDIIEILNLKATIFSQIKTC